MTDSAHAGALAVICIGADQVGRAAELLVDLRAAGPHGIGSDHLGFTAHLPRAALDAPSAPLLRPLGDRPRPPRWKHRRQANP